ncbi:CHAP domain-containing protein [Acidipropionibacterium timonense]|uniref:CHAP domain-containing protein n=1 Tax=Acidipropionibacterium timonense TaxID=2161818 RepID=UPI00143683EB|nr:CHAP domain-containing protein [Acidipropionibacterium timonense]
MESGGGKTAAGVIIGLLLVLLALPLLLVTSSGPSTSGQDTSVCGTGTLSVPAAATPWMQAASAASGLPVGWLAAVANQESSFDPSVFSPDSNGGTWGLFQLNRAEWHRFYPAGDNPGGTPIGITDPLIHAKVAGAYFKDRLATVRALKKAHPGAPFASLPDLDALVIAHNAGEGNLMRYPHIPAITQTYLVHMHAWFTGTTTCAGSGSADASGDAKAYTAWMAAGGFTSGDRRLVVDPNRFYYGECTSYAAWAIRTHTKYTTFTNFWRGQQFGNAGHWAAAARAAGIVVDTHPIAGAIAQSTTAAGGTGHVAYITRVYPDGTFDVAESNYVARHTFGTRSHVRLGADFTNILHFEK